MSMNTNHWMLIASDSAGLNNRLLVIRLRGSAQHRKFQTLCDRMYKVPKWMTKADSTHYLVQPRFFPIYLDLFEHQELEQPLFSDVPREETTLEQLGQMIKEHTHWLVPKNIAELHLFRERYLLLRDHGGKDTYGATASMRSGKTAYVRLDLAGVETCSVVLHGIALDQHLDQMWANKSLKATTYSGVTR